MTHYGFLSTYPPTRCGLATFTQALAEALSVHPSDSAAIVRVLDGPPLTQPRFLPGPPRAQAELIAHDRGSARSSARALNEADIAIIQHEYGIYGGEDGEEVLDVMRLVTRPMIVVLHTVLATPTAHQRTVLIQVCVLASRIVVMTQAARGILTEHYGVDAARVDVIPHGTPQLTAPTPAAHEGARVLTWGLISPGKGIEWGIRAMAHLTDLDPAVQYVVAGETHPKVRAQAGESYRDELMQLVAELGVSSAVQLDGRYLDARELAALVGSADVVLLPYDSRDQATSGVLAEAVAAGVPVVATGFPHAVELLSGGAGIVVAHEDPEAIAAALRTILSAAELSERMREAALRDASHTTWPAVADRFRALTDTLLAAQAA